MTSVRDQHKMMNAGTEAQDRELRIAIIRHDLSMPLRLIEDCALDVADRYPHDTRLSLDMNDIATSAMIARNLAQQLSPDPTAIKDSDVEIAPLLLYRDIVAKLRKLMGHYAQVEKDMTISSDRFESIPRLYTSRALVERSLLNVLMNAVKYGDRGTEIRISSHAAMDAYHVSVANAGTGVLSEEAEMIFEGTFRSPAHRHMAHGLGLGLKVARSAMRKCGGDLVLTNLRDPTLFTMLFPRSLARSHQ